MLQTLIIAPETTLATPPFGRVAMAPLKNYPSVAGAAATPPTNVSSTQARRAERRGTVAKSLRARNQKDRVCNSLNLVA